jgi:carboxypeptidase T
MDMERFDVLIQTKNLRKLREILKLDLDIKHRAARQDPSGMYTIPGILRKTEIDKLTSLGYKVDILRELSAIARERQAQVSADNRFAETQPISLEPSLTISGYLTNEEINAAINNLTTAHPAIATRIDLPNTTWEGRKSYAVHLRAGSKISRPGVLFTGGMHAREWGGSDICVAFMLQIVNAFVSGAPLDFGGKHFTAAQVSNMLNELDLFIFPNVNPDGKNYSQTTDIWWRKNRNPNGGGPAGVDINRNFDFLWSSGIGTSASKSSEIYRGAAPFSEPETRNVKYLFDTFPSIRYYLDIHSYSGLVLYSWGDDNNQNITTAQNFANSAYDGIRGTVGDAAYREFIPTLDENTLKSFASRMHDALKAVRSKDYIVEQSVGLYPTSATSDDYVFSRNIVAPSKQRVYGFTIEFGSEFVPPIAEMNLIKSDINAAMAELCCAACSDVYMADSSMDAGSVPSAAPFWNSPDVWVRNNDDGGVVHQDTIRGRDNYIYIKVRNRGAAAAANVIVRAYIATWAGTEFTHPADWIPLNPAGGGTIASPGTYLIGQSVLPSLLPAAAQIVKILWPKALIPGAAGWHPCLLVEASPNDGPVESGQHVWDNNNLAQKNITIVNAAKLRKLAFPFYVGSSVGTARTITVEVRKVKCPERIALSLAIDPEEQRSVRRYDHFVPIQPAAPTAFHLGPESNIGSITFAQQKAHRFLLTLSAEKPKIAYKNPFLFEIVQLDERGRPVGGVQYQVETAGLITPPKPNSMAGTKPSHKKIHKGSARKSGAALKPKKGRKKPSRR